MNRIERLKRIDDGDRYNRLLKLRGSEKNFTEDDMRWAESGPASDLNDSYYYAGVLPEVVIRPPKDNAVYKAKYMIPNKELRNAFYESINSGDVDVIEDYLLDQRTYVNRLWDLYNKSGKPTIKPISRMSQLPLRLLEKTGLLKYSDNRAHYKPITNTMYVDPEYAAEDIIAELSHAYQVYGTDTPRNWKWMKQFLSRPNGDMVINNKDGYDTPGSLEHTAHKIIEPAFWKYVTDNYDANQELPKNIQRSYNYEDAFRDIYTMYNNLDTYFKPIKIGPKKGM